MTRILLHQRLNVGDIVEISGDEHHYLHRVRRHGPGDRIEVRDDRGAVFFAVVETLQKRTARLRIISPGDKAGEQGAPVTMAVAVPKRNLMDDVVRKFSEIGVLKLIPLLAERTEHAPSPDRIGRWRRIAGEALRQCGRAHPLEVAEPVRFSDLVTADGLPERRLLLHPEGSASLSLLVRTSAALLLVVGPEGGFSKAETTLAVTKGFTPVFLPMPVLRIETAAVAAAVLGVALREESTENCSA